jgi:hypothetical protein
MDPVPDGASASSSSVGARNCPDYRLLAPQTYVILVSDEVEIGKQRQHIVNELTLETVQLCDGKVPLMISNETAVLLYLGAYVMAMPYGYVSK